MYYEITFENFYNKMIIKHTLTFEDGYQVTLTRTGMKANTNFVVRGFHENALQKRSGELGILWKHFKHIKQKGSVKH